jgi:Nucleoporin subcomplex protein binding to Pom34
MFPTLPCRIPLPLHVLTRRTWKSILRALQHPTYTTPKLKPTLNSRITKLQKCAEVYSPVKGQTAAVGDSITIDGLKVDVTPNQKELAEKLSKEVQLDATEALKIVLQQSRIGIVELHGLVKAYMEERTALLRIVKCLLRIDGHGCGNKSTESLAKEIASKVKDEKEFMYNLVMGIKSRIGQQLPPRAVTDSHSSALWSRQVRQTSKGLNAQILLEEYELLEIFFLVTANENVSSQIVTAWFDLLNDTLFFSNQRNVWPFRSL